jgi:hypothetical protein
MDGEHGVNPLQGFCKKLRDSTLFDINLTEIQPPAPKKPGRFIWEIIDEPWDLVEALD